MDKERQPQAGTLVLTYSKHRGRYLVPFWIDSGVFLAWILREMKCIFDKKIPPHGGPWIVYSEVSLNYILFAFKEEFMFLSFNFTFLSLLETSYSFLWIVFIIIRKFASHFSVHVLSLSWFLLYWDCFLFPYISVEEENRSFISLIVQKEIFDLIFFIKLKNTWKSKNDLFLF